MTQAFNLSQFANNVNSSGKTSNAGLQNTTITLTPSTGISISNTAPALGGNTTITNTGVTSLSAGANIALSASSGAVTISTTGSGVTSLNGQTGGITTTSVDSIGSTVIASNITGNYYVAGSTIGGGSLRVVTSITGTSPLVFTEGNNLLSYPFTYINRGNGDTITRVNSGNTGAEYPRGTTALSGTYRCMEFGYGGGSSYDPDNNSTQSSWFFSLWVRVS